jgi:hypothetical protein
MAASSLSRVGAINDRSALVTGSPTATAGVAASERPLSAAANWYYRPKAELQDRLLCGSLYQLSSSRAQRVHRTAHATPADLEHMRANHRRRNIGMAKQFLRSVDVVA